MHAVLPAGLTSVEARRRHVVDGANELPSDRQSSILSTVLHVVSEPMFLLLIGSGVVYIILGELSDALMLLSFVVVIIGITLFQERKTERTLASLRSLSSPRALVVRDGVQQRIAGRDVVVGDAVIIHEGDRIPADMVMRDCVNVMIDESLLTGESEPVRKTGLHGTPTPRPRPGGQDAPYAFSGSLVVSGHGIGEVTAIGSQTEIGRIGVSLKSITSEKTLIERETRHVVAIFASIGAAMCVLVVVAYLLAGGGVMAALLAGLTLMMAVLPEEFPVILTVFMTLGSWRISKYHVLTRKSDSIEMLGAASVLCVDKTGTLTENRMSLVRLFAGGSAVGCSRPEELHESHHRLLEYAALASQVDPFDPIEKEIHEQIQRLLGGTEHVHADWILEREYPLSKSLRALSHVWKSPDHSQLIVASKGAPETILELCHVSDAVRDGILAEVRRLSLSGLRILGVAEATVNVQQLPQHQHDFDFVFVGLLGFEDPVRPGVLESVTQAYAAGIRIVMITGDYAGTAQHVARQIGLRNPDHVLDGASLENLSPEELQDALSQVSIVARVIPEQKLAIVNALKARREIVAMTGDGINDAPALKAAHIGIAMGKRGTDVAREASSLVLLNDDFSSIVTAIRLGRRIYDNLRKAMRYTVAVHIPIAGMALLPPLLHVPMLLFPAHIAFLELIIDPACSTVFEAEPEEPGIMSRKPRSVQQSVLGRRSVALSLVQGISVLALVLIVYVLLIHFGRSEMVARTIAFSVLMLSNLLLIATNLTYRTPSSRSAQQLSNGPFWSMTVASIAALVAIIGIPFLRSVFHFAPLNGIDYVLIVLTGAGLIAWFEALKYLGRKRALRHPVHA